MMGNWGYGGYGMMGGFGLIGTILFWILLILAIVWLWRSLDLGQTLRNSGSEGQSSSERVRPRALDIAKERYARGEISKEDFEQLKQDLS